MVESPGSRCYTPQSRAALASSRLGRVRRALWVWGLGIESYLASLSRFERLDSPRRSTTVVDITDQIDGLVNVERLTRTRHTLDIV